MAEKTKTNKRNQEIKGLVLLALAAIFLLCLFSYHPQDPSFTRFVADDTPTQNYMGYIGSYTADSLIRLLGFSSFLLPLVFFLFSLKYFLRPEFEVKKGKVLAFAVFVLTVSGLLSLIFNSGVTIRGEQLQAGGLVGSTIVKILLYFFNKAGSYIILFVLFIITLISIVEFSLVSLTERFFQSSLNIFSLIKDKIMDASGFLLRKFRKDKMVKTVMEEKPAPAKKTKPKKIEQTHFEFTRTLSDSKYELPPLTLLEESPHKDTRVKRDSLITNSRILEKKLADFGVAAKVTEVIPGPVITMYEVEPAPGVKINRITNLADDLALALMAPSIRIIAPIPGKSVIGIEIPNLKREHVYLKEVLDNEDFLDSPSRLPIALGVNFVGAPVIADLTRMPHLLIAGTTGSGKSVALNAMICSILFKARPDDVKFLMIDPKRLELSSYGGIPHLIHPVVVDPKKASQVLRWTVEEVERRYRVISDVGAKSIDFYNALIAKGPKSKAFREAKEEVSESWHQAATADAVENEQQIEHVRLPYIVVIIDELADLMMVAPRDVEESLTRLAQMARAAGIHLIIATQRPSVDVITGLIKANFPTRISFQVSSKIDSRTIIDQQGAEQLLGAGDMLFIPPGTSKLSRIHGAYVSDKEITRIVDFIKLQAQPSYDASIEKFQLAAAQSQHEEDDDDEKYGEAVALVSELGQASISLVQRYMKIGYNRAARIIEQMEREGIVGPSDGAKPRKVLVRKLPR
ncbi:MAG TPA: DNA translocase FtsK 4TM domain-containing protein [Smithellaceae bacterium]|nr:DNA translocase FtsK 4TM domain-containing protein [Smithellaceae bacterium]HRS89256.1 DNA translocase FtsK 4TM domain-containing protein [Smithellaceae bacterium]HRV26286.1 DNA translocase FtsK 4TM domain-containing protein [Smithellaceae bacterium]